MRNVNNPSSRTVGAKKGAEYIGISYGKFLQLVREGRVPVSRAGKKILCRTETLDAWLDNQELQSKSTLNVLSENEIIRRVKE